MEVESSTLIGEDNATYKAFLASKGYEVFKRHFSSKKFGDIKLVKFKNSNSSALEIELKENFLRSGSQVELIVGISEIDPTLMVPAVIETELTQSNNTYSGSVSS